MNIAAVSYHENGLRTVAVKCGMCGDKHEVGWPFGRDAITAELPCGPVVSIDVPAWARNPRRDRRHYRFDPVQDRRVSAGVDRDDQAIDEPVPNWTE